MRCCDQAHLNRLGSRLKTGLEDLFAKRDIMAQVVVTGSVFSIHIDGLILSVGNALDEIAS